MSSTCIGYSKEEIIPLCGELMDLDAIHKRLLEMMIEFDGFCRANGLTYYMADGTLLGAVRHKGFIPWDDDIDIYMLRDDYNILRDKTYISNNLLIVTHEHSHGYYYPYTYINIVDKTTIMVANSINTCTGKGLSIDILPVDKVPNDNRIRKKFLKSIMNRRRALDLLQARRKTFSDIKGISRKIVADFISIFINETNLIKSIDELACSYEKESSDKRSQLLLVKPLIFDDKTFKDPIEIEFEGYRLYAPQKYDEYLHDRYGDYMIPPPENKRYNHDMKVYISKNPDYFSHKGEEK